MKTILNLLLIPIVVISWTHAVMAGAAAGLPQGQGATREVLTLARAKEIALAQSPTLASYQEKLIQAKEQVKQAQAARLPTLSYDSSWTQTEKLQSSSMEKSQYSNTLSATQVIFDGFSRKSTLLSATLGEKISWEAQKDAERLILWSVASTYVTLQLTLENKLIAEGDMAYNERQAKEARASQRIGNTSLSDVLNFETGVNTAKASLLTARIEYRDALYTLAALLGQRDPSWISGLKVGTIGEDALENTPPSPLEEDVAQALISRPDLKQATYAVEDAETQIKVARSAYYPVASLNASYGADGDWDTVSDAHDQETAVGISISFDLFTGGATRAKVAEATSQKRESEQNLRQARIDAAWNIRTAAETIDITREQVALQDENTKLIQRTRDLVEKEYRAGQTSLVRLNEAQNNLVTAQGSLAKAKANLLLAKEEFDYYTGKILL